MCEQRGRPHTRVNKAALLQASHPRQFIKSAQSRLFSRLKRMNGSLLIGFVNCKRIAQMSSEVDMSLPPLTPASWRSLEEPSVTSWAPRSLAKRGEREMRVWDRGGGWKREGEKAWQHARSERGRRSFMVLKCMC